jgi:hypothetical protein
VDDSVGRTFGGLWHAGAEWAAELYHPLFNAPNFRNGATTDKFFLCLEALDPKFDGGDARLSGSLTPVSVVEVEY